MRAVVLVLGLVLVASASWASTPESRFLSRSEFQREVNHNKRLAAYVARNGYPDAAEWRSLSDEPPWDDHEVTCYYLDERREVSFANAWILEEPTIPLERYRRHLSDADVEVLRPLAMQDDTRHTGDPVARAEAAAARAEAAVQRIEVAADATERAAARAEAIVAKMTASSPHRHAH